MRWFGLVWAAVLLAAAPQARCWAAAGGAVVAQGSTADEAPLVLSQTREYCDRLSAQAAQLRRQRAAPLAEADLLAGEGDRLCAHGQVRPGILRLRRAIMLLRGEPSTEMARP